MGGHLSYLFVSEGDGTMLIQRETLATRGPFKALAPIIKLTLGRALDCRGTRSVG